ncbi:SEL1-like repeat protein [Novosphingobium huizhouense]|uniref:SEL1-like repeat protein n=1 Tax=Novosphingobium huizhouense TaxID=2866625 RepID=UPI001CD90B43|nr:SEL1-like repeat protein [Novosphingobium huizhouense]
MTRTFVRLGLFAALLAATPLHAQFRPGPVRMPGDDCPNTPYPADPAVVLSPEQETAVRCWFEAGSNDAGLRLVQSHMANRPVDFAKVLGVLAVMVGDPIKTSSSLGGRTMMTQAVRSSRIGFGDTVTPTGERQRSPIAMRILAQLYMAGRGVDKDPEAALKWIKRAETGGDQVATDLHAAWLAKGLVAD